MYKLRPSNSPELETERFTELLGVTEEVDTQTHMHDTGNNIS